MRVPRHTVARRGPDAAFRANEINSPGDATEPAVDICRGASNRRSSLVTYSIYLKG